MPLFKNEKELIRKIIVPKLKEHYFIRTSVNVKRLHSKLLTEGTLSPEEQLIKHPLHPDIDILYWPKTYTGEPTIHAAEVKYFRLNKKGLIQPSIYEGIGEAMTLLTYGCDYVHLWHFFDPKLTTEMVGQYEEITQSIIEVGYPINYWSKTLETPKEEKESKEINWLDLAVEIASTIESFLEERERRLNLKYNPMKSNENAKVIRTIIKRGYRIVSK